MAKLTADEKIRRAEMQNQRRKDTHNMVMDYTDRALTIITNPIIMYIGGIIAVNQLYYAGIIRDRSLRDGMEIVLDGAMIAHALGKVPKS